MAFEKVQTLETDNTISLGGTNKKTGKINPARVEGYFLGSRKVPDQKKKDGFSFIHVFKTAKGDIGVWGKTHMDRQLAAVELGTMTRVTANGKTRQTKNGDMILFDVEVDSDNTIPVAGNVNRGELEEGYVATGEDGGEDLGGYDSGNDGGYEAEEDEREAPEPVAPPVNAKASADRQARVNALLKSKTK